MRRISALLLGAPLLLCAACYHSTTLAATWHEQRLSARYREGTRVVRRTLDPLGLVLKGGAWYLVARRSAGMRVYRVSRFVSVRVRHEPFERPEDFDLGAYWQEWSRTFEASRPRVEVKLRASELALRHLPRDLQEWGGTQLQVKRGSFFVSRHTSFCTPRANQATPALKII